MLANARVNVAEVVLAKVCASTPATSARAAAGQRRARPRRRQPTCAGAWVERRGLADVYGDLARADGDRHRRWRPSRRTSGSPRPASSSPASATASAVVCNALLVQRGAPDALRGRVFTVLMSSNYAVLGARDGRRRPLDRRLGARWVWGVVGVSRRGRRGRRLRAGARDPRASAPIESREPIRPRPALSIAPWRGGDWTRETLAAGVRAGDRRALARAITLVENARPARLRARPRPLPGDRRRLRRRRHRAARASASRA